MKKFFLLISFFLVFFESCTSPKKIVVWTDLAELASFIEHFNASQSEICAILVYKDKLASEIQNISGEQTPDIAIGSFLMNSRSQKIFAPLDSLLDLPNENGFLSEKKLDLSSFYAPLLEYGRFDGKQLLLTASFNLPIIAFSKKNSTLVPTSHTIELEELRDSAAVFNAKNKNGIYTQMGFAPSWNADFIYTAAKMNGAEFMEVGRSFGWNLSALDRTLEFMRDWTKEKNSSSDAEQDFSFKYLYTPPYKQISSGRCLFTYSTTDEFFSLSPEQIENSDFRWLTSSGEIFAEDNIVTAGIFKKSHKKSAAKKFLRWIFDEETQKNMLDRAEKMKLGDRTFGIFGGFSSLKSVNERFFPAHYKNLIGNLPGEDSILAPLALSPKWNSLKRKVLIPYLSDATKTEPPHKMQTIDERLKVWTKQFE